MKYPAALCFSEILQRLDQFDAIFDCRINIDAALEPVREAPLQGAYRLAGLYRFVGEWHAIRNPYYTPTGLWLAGI